MLASSEPRAAYQQANFDARVQGGTAQDIVVYCLDELALTLGMLRQADMRGNPAGRSAAITRGIAILTALEMGIDRENPLAVSVTQVDAIEALRADVIEIRDALQAASSAAN